MCFMRSVVFAVCLTGALWVAACGTTPIKVAGEIGGSDDGGVTSTLDGGATPLADGGPQTTDGAAAPRDAGPTTPTGGVVCGQVVCDADREDCCVSRGGQMCGARGSCPGTALSCTGAASCPSPQQCCLSGGRMGAQATCADACPGPRACAMDGDCAAGEMCFVGRNGVGVCGPTGPMPSLDGGLPPPPGDGGRPPRGDAGPPPPDTGLSCGRTSCDPTTQECCVSRQGAMCVARGDCMGTALSCTNARACMSGQVCCATFTGGGGGGGGSASTSCQATCERDGGGGISVQLCSSQADCPSGQPCTRGPLGLGVCGAFGMGGGGMGGG